MDRFPPKTLKDLEWSRLLSHLAKRCSSEEAAARCLELPFLPEDQAPEHMKRVEEFISCIEKGDLPPTLSSHTVSEWLVRIRGEGSVPGEALRQIAANLKLFVSIARYLDNRRDACPGNAADVLPEGNTVSILGLARLSGEIETSFEPDGSIADGASPELGKLRRRAVSLRSNLVSRIERIAEAEEDLLQERVVTIRNDRFVIPVRADAHRKLPGIVHGASGSGATIFVEPEKVIEMGNDLMLAREHVLREEARIIASLCGAVRDEYDEVLYACKTIVTMEMRIAAARLCHDLGAAIPVLTRAGDVDLLNARHPLLLLEGVRVISSDIKGAPAHCLVISGPNAGGKTVILKTVGLLGLMLAAGLPIPVDPDSRFGIPRQVLTDIGDDQSLQNNLSTFSAHMTNIASILGQARSGTIILLDELAAGTDPGEGAALAEAFLERLNTRDATTFATTHFDTLKGRAEAKPQFSNGAVGFDMQTMQPTFAFHMGIPGSSSALVVARRFGIPEEVTDLAKALLPRGMRELSRAVEALEEERRKVSFEHSALMKTRKEAEEAKRKNLDELAKLRARQSQIIDREAQTLWSEMKRAREKLQDVEKSIRRRNAKIATVADGRKIVNQIAEELSAGGSLSSQTAKNAALKPIPKEEIAMGKKVFVKTFSAEGVVDSELRGDRVHVRIGNIRTRVSVGDLGLKGDAKSADGPAPGPAISRRQTAPLPQPTVDKSQALRTQENTVDLRGMRADEAVEATDGFLDKASSLD